MALSALECFRARVLSLYTPPPYPPFRFKYLLGCGSAVVFLQTHPYTEFWFGLLENGTNVLMLPYERERTAEKLYSTVQALRANDSLARQLGQGALRLFREGLQPSTIPQYWYKLLTGGGSTTTARRRRPSRSPAADGVHLRSACT